MIKALVVTLGATLTLSLGLAVPPQPDGVAPSPDFICRFWPSAPGCRW